MSRTKIEKPPGNQVGRRSDAARAKGRVTLARADVVAAAARVLDDEGVDGLSMRRVAAELGTGPGTLYWHVRDKDELLALILDATIADIAPPDTGRWDERLVVFCTDLRRAVRPRPVLVPVIWGAGWQLGPETLRVADTLLGLVAQSGLADEEVPDAYFAVLTFVTGFISAETLTPGNAAFSDEAANLDEATAAELASRLPHLARFGPGTDADGMDRRFEYGLRRLTDALGSRARTTNRVTTARSRPQPARSAG